MLTLSVIIPVLDGLDVLPRCLECVTRSAAPPLECIVVDDCSRDRSAAIAEAAGAGVLRAHSTKGPAAARNLGAAHSSGDVLVFIDADVCIREDTLERIRARFESDPRLDAVFGSYDDEPAAAGIVSQFKNLSHHYVHQRGRAEASTFWSGCGAIRRAAFEAAGGFNESYARPGIEDIELGYRLSNAGRRIVLDAGIQVKHLKQWGFWSMLRSDICDRALPWTRLILRSSRLPNDLNLSASQRMSAALVLASTALAVLGFSRVAWFALALLPLAFAILLNLDFYRFLAGKRGWLFAVCALPLHLAYYLYSPLAFAAGVCLHLCVWRRQDAARSAVAPPRLPCPSHSPGEGSK